MSRVDDLVGLIQATNDIHLVNPGRNVRMAYIQIDDLCELAMKSWLQLNVPDWSPISHQHQGRDYYKGFKTVINEVKFGFPGNQILHEILDRFDDRRENRNRFFHNQNLAGLTVTLDECSKAFCDIYDLMGILFGSHYHDCLSRNPVLRAQIAVVRLNLHAAGAGLVREHYKTALADSNPIALGSFSDGFEYHQIYRDPGAFLDRVRVHFSDEVFERDQSIAYIQSLSRLTKKHKTRLQHLQSERDTIQSAIDTCLT